MAPKIKPSDLVEALQDPQVCDALCKALSGTLSLIVNEAVSEKLDKVLREVQDLRCGYKELKAENERLLHNEMEFINRLEELETYSKLDNLIIHGLPESSYAERASGGSPNDMASRASADVLETEKSVVSLCAEKLHLPITSSDISSAHRLRKGPRDTVRPVVVRFTSRKARDSVYYGKRALRTEGSTNKIYISEHLTKKASEIFFEARKMVRDKKITASWSSKGMIFVKRSAQQNEKPTLIKNAEDLARLLIVKD